MTRCFAKIAEVQRKKSAQASSSSCRFRVPVSMRTTDSNNHRPDLLADDMTEKEQPTQQDSNQIVEERRAKLRELRTQGQAFPNDYRRSHLAAELHAGYDAK